MNLVTFHTEDLSAIGSSALDGSCVRTSSFNKTSGGTTTQTWIVYNGNSNTPYAEFNGSGTLLERYLAGPSYVPGVTGMVARTNASGVTDWYLTGKLGSVRDIVDASGTVIDHITYDAFGGIHSESNPSSGSQFKFDGMQYDTISGLYNDWHRVYSSKNGLFMRIDPIGLSSLDTNTYRYVNNNPTNYTDPKGLFLEDGTEKNTPQIPFQGNIGFGNPDIPPAPPLVNTTAINTTILPPTAAELGKNKLVINKIKVLMKKSYRNGTFQEWGCGILQDKEGYISFTNILSGPIGFPGINLTQTLHVPKNQTLVGIIHTHPRPIVSDPSTSPLDPRNSALPIFIPGQNIPTPAVPWLVGGNDGNIYSIGPPSRGAKIPPGNPSKIVGSF